MFKSLFLSIMMTGVLTTPVLSTPKQSRVTDTDYNIVNTTLTTNYFIGGCTYQFDVQGFFNALLTNAPISTSSHTIFRLQSAEFYQNDYIVYAVDDHFTNPYDSNDLYFDSYYINNTYKFELYTDENEELVLGSIDSTWTYSFVDIPYLYFSVSFNLTSTNGPAGALINNNVYKLPYRSFINNYAYQKVLTSSSNEYLNFYDLQQVIDTYKPYQNMILEGLWRRADSNDSSSYAYMKKNAYYNKLVLYYSLNGTSKRYNLFLYSQDSTFNTSYTNLTTLGYVTGEILVLSPIKFNLNYMQLQYGMNYAYPTFSSYTPPVTTYTLNDLLWGVVDVPIYTLFSLFNVEVLGVNMFIVVTGLLTAVVVVWVIRKFI